MVTSLTVTSLLSDVSKPWSNLVHHIHLHKLFSYYGYILNTSLLSNLSFRFFLFVFYGKKIHWRFLPLTLYYIKRKVCHRRGVLPGYMQVLISFFKNWFNMFLSVFPILYDSTGHAMRHRSSSSLPSPGSSLLMVMSWFCQASQNNPLKRATQKLHMVFQLGFITQGSIT